MRIASSVVVCLALASNAWSDEDRRVPTYTNEDLARVSARRGETGVGGEPASAPERARARERPSPHGEPYWRREAERERRRLEPLRRRFGDLERRLDERRREPGVRPYSDPLVESLVAQIRALGDRIREEAGRFDDRARREGALPGWLR